MKATEVIRLYNRDNSIINSNQIAIAKQVLGLHEINFSQLVVSPFRVDKNPTCSFYISKAGFLLFKDWALDEAYDLVDIICKKLSIGEDEAIKIIKNGEKSTSKVLYTVKSKEVSVLPRQISEFDLYLWGKWGVDKSLLELYRVIPVKYYYINNTIRAKDSPKNPIYCYPYFPSGSRIYRPLASNKQEKHISYCTKDTIFGLDQIPIYGKILIITKSPKDVISMRSLGFNAVCSQSETTVMPPHYIETFKSRFKYIFTLMDWDKAGKTVSTKYKNMYDINNLFFMYKAKDASDNIAKYGKRKTQKCIQKMLSRALRKQ